MRVSNLLGALRWAVSRMGFVYLLALAGFLLIADVKNLQDTIKVRRLNDLMVDLDMMTLVSFGKGEIPVDKVPWAQFFDYFQLVHKYAPSERSSQMLLGFCEYHMPGRERAAFEHIRESADRNQYIFWNVYNTGVLALKKGDLPAARKYLEKAIILPSDRANYTILSSVVYRQVVAAPNFNLTIKERINEAKGNAFVLLVAANFYEKNYQKVREMTMNSMEKMPLKDRDPLYFYAGAANISLGNIEEGTTLLLKAVALHSRNSQVYRYAGDILRTSGRKAEAEALFKLAAELEKERKAPSFPYPERLQLRIF